MQMNTQVVFTLITWLLKYSIKSYLVLLKHDILNSSVSLKNNLNFMQVSTFLKSSSLKTYLHLVVILGTSIFTIVCCNGTQQIPSLLGQKELFSGPWWCINWIKTSSSASKTSLMLPIHHCRSYTSDKLSRYYVSYLVPLWTVRHLTGLVLFHWLVYNNVSCTWDSVQLGKFVTYPIRHGMHTFLTNPNELDSRNISDWFATVACRLAFAASHLNISPIPSQGTSHFGASTSLTIWLGPHFRFFFKFFFT